MLRYLVTLVLAMAALCGHASSPEQKPPSPFASATSWTDPLTGHKVIRISRLRGQGSSSFYFTQNAFTGDGKLMVFKHQNDHGIEGFYTVDLSNSADPGSSKLTHIVDVSRTYGQPVVGKKSRDIFYFDNHSILATNIDTHKTRTVVTFPSSWDFAEQSLAGLTLNSDETLLAGSQTAGAAATYEGATATRRQDRINATWAAHLPTLLWTVEVKTGKLHVILKGNDWFNHVQFSPADPNQLMFCHEGPWERVDRIWLIRSDGSGLTNFSPHKVAGDSAGHEFWAPDGKTIWFDYSDRKTRSLTGKNINTGEEISYTLSQPQISVHYNISHDGKFFAADGGTYNNNQNPMIQLFLPQADGSMLFKDLTSMKNNDYLRREPNVMLTPDDRWVIYGSTQSGKVEVYAVSVQ
jgi:oligogalacturonide lyase